MKEHSYYPGIAPHIDVASNIDLQLLVIDLGDSCVLKNEGRECQLKIGDNTVDLSTDDVRVWRSTFSELRQDIDALESKPVPRIERRYKAYALFARPDDQCARFILQQDEVDALSALAGKPLPVYEGKKGEWVRLNTHDWTQAKQDAGEAGYGIDTFSYEDAICPVKIYRYTRELE